MSLVQRIALRAFAVMVSAMLVTACSSPEDRVKESLDDWDSTIIRYSWDCSALALSLERWMEMNEESLREDVLALASEASDMDVEDRNELFREVTSGDKAAEAQKKLAACGDSKGVNRQLSVMTDILMPIIMIDNPPEPAPPPKKERGDGDQGTSGQGTY